MSNIDMTRKNLEGLNTSISRSRERDKNDIPPTKVNMYKFLESNRPPTTSTNRHRLKDNYMVQRLGSPMSRDANTMEFTANQSNYSMEGTPMKDAAPAYDSLPPRAPTPPPPQMSMPQSTHSKS